MDDNRFSVYIVLGTAMTGVLVMAALVFFTSNSFVNGQSTYSLCQPEGYEVVCFGTKGIFGSSGQLSCLPLSQLGGKCL